MAITLVGTPTVFTPSSATTSRTVNVPSGVADGDTILVLTCKAGSANGFTIGAGTLSGLVEDTSDSRSGIWSTVFKKENALASDAGKTIILTTASAYRASVIVVVYRGVPTGSVVDVILSNDANGSVHNCPAVTSTVGGLVLNFIAGVTGSTGSQTWATPSGFTKIAESSDPATSGGASAVLFHRDAPIGPATTFPQQGYTPSVGSTTYVGWTIILKERAAATSTVPGSVKSNAGSWVAVGAANQTAAVADSSDSSYIETATNPTNASIEFNLADTLESGQVTVVTRARLAEGGSGAVTTLLKQGSTVIASWTDTVTASWANYSHTTTSAQAANITDPSQLSVEVRGTAS